jgi:hypothetical protein
MNPLLARSLATGSFSGFDRRANPVASYRAKKGKDGNMILATHLIISAYGFWLPNDDRGSWSDFIGSWELLKFGPATKVTDARNHAKDPYDREHRLLAKQSLKYRPVRFSDEQRQAIAAGFDRAIREADYPCKACCIGHDQAHLLLGRHDRDATIIAGHLKSHATRELTARGVHPLANFVCKRGTTPTPWSEGCWKVFIDDQRQVGTAVGYVDQHADEEGLPRQRWSFVH